MSKWYWSIGRLAICLILISLAFVPFTSPHASAQNDEDLAQVIAAYESYMEWESYTGETAHRKQVAFTLRLNDDILNMTDSNLSYFAASYDVADRAVEGKLNETRSYRLSRGVENPEISEFTADLSVVAVDGEIMLSGETISAGETTTIATPEVFVTDSESPLTNLSITNMADFDEARDMEAFIQVLAESGQILDKGTTDAIPQYEGTEVTVYNIVMNGQDALEALKIDVPSLFSQLLATDAVDEDTFLEAFGEDTFLYLVVYLNAETGALVGENLTLDIDLEWSGSQLNGANAESVLYVQYSYEGSMLYANVNVPVEISLPVDDEE